MNTYFGHAMAALFVMITVYGLLKKDFLLVGFGFGMTLLCEYSAAILLPALIIALILEEKKIKDWLLPFMAGGLLPGLIWVWYHVSTFGSPFQTAIQHENPMFIEQAHQNLLFGMIALKPNWPILYELTLGTKRGLAFTQPWVLFIFTIIIFKFKRLKSDHRFLIFQSSLVYLTLGLLTLIWLNSGFNGWHAGGSSGPRYLCMIIPAMGMVLPLIYDNLNGPVLKKILIYTIAIAIVFRGLVYASEMILPPKPLWSEAIRQILDSSKPLKKLTKLCLYFIPMLFAAISMRKNCRGN
jgi:uncharacterized membrane protein YhaH (DUF805 family)